MESGSPSPAASRRIGVGDVVNETFSVYGQNFGALFGSALAVFIVVGLAAGILEGVDGVILLLCAGILRLAGHALYTGFVVKLVEDTRDGKRDFTAGDLLSAASPFILPLIGFGILFGIAIVVGLFIFVIPGLILLTIWAVGAPALVVEGIGPIDAFGRSRQLVRGNGWQVFGVLLVVLLIVIAIGAVLAIVANPIGNGEVSTWIAAVISTTLTAPIFAIAVSVLYFELGGGGAAPPAAQVTETP